MRNDLHEIHIAVSRIDDGVSVMSIIDMAPLKCFDPEAAAAAGFREVDGLWIKDVTDDDIERELGRTTWEQGVSLKDVSTGWKRIEAGDIPADRTFRNAWRHDAENGFGVDMPKAREIHRARLREKRAPLLAALDIDYQRADETGDTKLKKTIAAKKKALRDATDDASIEAAATPEELAQAIPEALR